MAPRPRVGVQVASGLQATGGRGADTCPLSQAPRVCRTGADLGGPPPALCAGFQPNRARVEAGLWAAGVVRRPRAEVCAGVPGSRVGAGWPGWGAVLTSGPSPCSGGPTGRRGLWEGCSEGDRDPVGQAGTPGGVWPPERGKAGAQPAKFCGTAAAEPLGLIPRRASAKPFIAQDFISKSN